MTGSQRHIWRPDRIAFDDVLQPGLHIGAIVACPGSTRRFRLAYYALRQAQTNFVVPNHSRTKKLELKRERSCYSRHATH